MTPQWIALASVMGLLSGNQAVYADDQRPSQSGDSAQGQSSQAIPHEKAVSTITPDLIPGDRLVAGRIREIRGGHILVDIGSPQVLYIPLKPAQEKGQVFKEGDHIIVVMNDHNAIVDYHHVGGHPEHQVIIGRLSTSLTVGLDKAVIRTDGGERTFRIASRARTKLGAVPIGETAVFLADETGQLVDAQLISREAVQASAENNKSNVKGAHAQVHALYGGRTERGVKVAIEKQGEREMPIRPPLQKLDRLQPGQEIVLLVDEEGFVIEIATPDLPPVR
ncbi:MAG: hypothetical protein QM771_20260 [Nitrospira sp.]